jgi:hypothetical protein
MYTSFHTVTLCDVGIEGVYSMYMKCQSGCPRGLRCGSAAARLLGLQFQIPSGTWMYVCCLLWVEGPALGSSFVQRSPTNCCVPGCNRKASIMKRPWHTVSC